MIKMTIGEIAIYLGVSNIEVNNFIKKGKFRCYKHKEHGKMVQYVNKAQLDAFKDQRQKDADS